MNIFRAFMELDEAYTNRQSMIDAIKKAGKQYNFEKYTDAQLFRIWQRLQKSEKDIKEPKHELDLDFDDRFAGCCEYCGRKLSDGGFCPVCDDGEEDLNEWTSISGKQVNNTVTSATNGKYIVTIVSHGGRLRALATDGTHPAAWVAFPNDLRQFEGQKYEVDQLIWNGKNYRVAGNIIEKI
jgi:hypothetical protein